MQKAVQGSQSNTRIVAAKFTAAHRLLREDRFDHVVHESNIVDKYFKVFYVQNSEENARLGIIVSKRTLPRAVDRNKVKRMVREAFRRHGIGAKKLDLVVLVRSPQALEPVVGVEMLNSLFGRIEDRCAAS